MVLLHTYIYITIAMHVTVHDVCVICDLLQLPSIIIIYVISITGCVYGYLSLNLSDQIAIGNIIIQHSSSQSTIH